jgi:hypothetical protein
MNDLQTSSTSTNPLLEAVVESIFAKMLLDYGKKFTDQWGAADSDKLKAHWTAELTGFTPREIKRGLTAMDECDWPPTLPTFKKMCRPPMDPLMAYHEAIAGLEARGKGEWGTWSHPAIYWAAMLLRVDLMGQSYGQMKDRWASVLKGHLDRTEWAEIPPPRVMLPPPETSPAAKELADKMVKELGAAGVLKTEVQGDGRGWARKIIEREKRGEKLTITVLKMAREALQTTA